MKLPLNSSCHPSSRMNISSISSSVYFIITYIKGRMKLPLKPDGQWPRTVIKKKVVLVHSYGFQNNDKVKKSANGVAILPQKPSARQGCWNEKNRRFFCSCWVLKNRNWKVKKLEWEMWRTERGINRLKNQNEKCENRLGGINGLKIQSEKFERPDEEGSME